MLRCQAQGSTWMILECLSLSTQVIISPPPITGISYLECRRSHTLNQPTQGHERGLESNLPTALQASPYSKPQFLYL